MEEEPMDFTRSFRYVFDDKDWLSKVGLGLVIGIVPILNFALIGYQVQIIRNVRDHEAVELPTWDDLGKKFVDGLIIALANFLYILPIFLVVCLPLAFIFVPVLVAQDQNSMNVFIASSLVIASCLLCLAIIYAVAFSIFSPVILILYAKEGTFTSCFKVREIVQTVVRHAGPFFTIWLVNIGVNLGASLAIGIVSGVFGWIPLIGQLLVLVLSIAGPAYVFYFSSHLYGQFAALASDSALESKA
jgi:hypothetical protein